MNIPAKADMTVHICARDIMHFDAVGNFCRQVAILLENAGFKVRLWAENTNVETPHPVENRAGFLEALKKQDILFFNYSIHDPALEMFASLPNSKLAYYHNITPPNLIAEWDAETIENCRLGLEQSWRLSAFDLILVNSQFTASILSAAISAAERELSYPDPTICPPIVGANRWKQIRSADSETPSERPILLAVGRLIPHKGLLEILSIMREFGRDGRHATLNIVGGPPGGPYSEKVQAEAQALMRESNVSVRFYFDISNEQLKSLYQSCTACITHSAHEGFCVPALDALVFDKPMFTIAQPAILEVLGDSALVIPPEDPFGASSVIDAFFSDAARQSESAKMRAERLSQLTRLADGLIILDEISKLETAND